MKQIFVVLLTFLLLLAVGCSKDAAPEENTAPQDSAPTQDTKPVQDTAPPPVVPPTPAKDTAPPPAPAKEAVPPATPPAQEPAPKEPSKPVAQPKPPSVSGDNFLPKVESKVIEYINEERKSLGLEPLVYSENLHMAARIRSEELYASNTFAHKRPDGRSWETVLSEDVPTLNTGYGENLAMMERAGADTFEHRSAKEWFTQWKNSPTHYDNMMRPEFTHIGIGVYFGQEGDEYRSYATTTFGVLQ